MPPRTTAAAARPYVRRKLFNASPSPPLSNFRKMVIAPFPLFHSRRRRRKRRGTANISSSSSAVRRGWLHPFPFFSRPPSPHLLPPRAIFTYAPGSYLTLSPYPLSSPESNFLLNGRLLTVYPDYSPSLTPLPLCPQTFGGKVKPSCRIQTIGR